MVVTIINKAVDAFAAYSGSAFLQQPAFERSEFDAPDATFSSSSNHDGESSSILGLMDNLLNDAKLESAQDDKDEKASILEFEDAMNVANTDWEALDRKHVSLDERITQLGEDITREGDAKDDDNVDLKDKKDFQASIKVDCDWLLKNFEDRNVARDGELEGIESAVHILSGGA